MKQKKVLLGIIFGVFILVFLVSGVLAENQTCITEPGKAYYPGTEKCCDNLTTILPKGYYDENCNKLDVVGAPICAPCGNGICESEYGEDKCNCPEDCNQTCAKEGEMYSFAYPEYPQKCCEGLTEWASGMDSRIVENGICKETGLLKGAPVGICIKCTDGVCGSNETVCNCPEDCKADCTKNENNQSCCKNGICIRIFDDGLPSSCSDGHLPTFYGCDADCKVVVECKNHSYEDEINATGLHDVICTADVKQCADGSYVSRAGPKCGFMPCPEAKLGFFARIINWFKNLFR